MKAYVKPDFAI